MKKLYFVLATLLLSVSTSYATWYVCGDGTDMSWDPSNPLEFNADSFTLENVSACKISTTKGTTPDDWEGFNAGAITVSNPINRSPAVMVPYHSGSDNITFGWASNWSIEITTFFQWFAFTASTPKPTAVQEAQADAETSKVIKTIENGQVILNYPDGSKRNTLGQPLKK